MNTRIKFITVNILEGGVFFDNLLNFFDNEQPDIVCLQEVFNGKNKNHPRNHKSLLELKKYFKNYHYHYAPEFLYTNISKIEPIEFGNAVFSSFPITKSSITYYNSPYNPNYSKPFRGIDYSDDPCNVEYVQLDIDGKVLHIYNTHGVWGLDGEDNARRLAMSEMIIKTISGKEPLILAGDFNVRPYTKTIKNIEEYLVNVFKDELISTFNMKYKDNPGYATSVVDMVFVSPSIRVLEHYCPDVDVSDHYPLVCTFEISL